MYAVIETGGKQYRVEVGTELEVEHLDVEPGDAITLDRVLLVADGADASIGRPIVADAVVAAEVLRQDRGEKVISFKYRPKARRRVKKGHRQELTVIRVTDVRLGGRSAADDVRKAEAAEQSERERLQAAAARQAAVDQELAARLAATTPETPPTPATTEKPARGRRAAATETTEAAPAETPKRARKSAADATDATDADAGSDATDKPARAPRTKKES
jgi:large subunit ribosomal protein L21